MSYTYIIIDTESFIEYEGWLVKIGKSKNPHGRMAGFRTANPGTLELLATIPGGDWERLLHYMFDPYRVRGEWFRLDLSRLAMLASIADEHDESCYHFKLLKALYEVRGAHNYDGKCLVWDNAYDIGMDDGIAMEIHEAEWRAQHLEVVA